MPLPIFGAPGPNAIAEAQAQLQLLGFRVCCKFYQNTRQADSDHGTGFENSRYRRPMRVLKLRGSNFGGFPYRGIPHHGVRFGATGRCRPSELP